MRHPSLSRLLGGLTTALLGAGALAVLPAPAHGATALHDFAYADGWRVDQHVRELADVNADHRADIVGFGDAGVWVSTARADGTFDAPRLWLGDFGRNQGWRVDRHPRELEDINIDGRADIVGFGDAGVWVSFARAGGGFTAPVLKLRDFGWNQGWRVDRHPRMLADLTRDGAEDVVGFGASGVHVSHGVSTGDYTTPEKKSGSYGYDRGWRVDKHPRVLADVDRDGFEDVVAFGDAGTYVSYFSTQGGTFAPAALKVADYGYQQGWRVGTHPRDLADADRDGIADVVAIGHAGVYVSYGRADRTLTAPGLKVRNFGTAQGWRADRHLRVVEDFDFDGAADVVGFGDHGVHVAHSIPDSTSFGPSSLQLAGYGYAQGWTEDRYPRRTADLNNGGRPDIVGFGHSATWVTVR